MTDRYIFSRRNWVDMALEPSVSIATMVFFQMWARRASPYNQLAEGDVIYLGDTKTRRISWEVRVSDLLVDFGYRTPRHALAALRASYGLYESDLNDYHRGRSGSGWLLAWSPTVMRQLDLTLPAGQQFGRNGYRLIDDADASAIGLPRPSTGKPLAVPPPWYDPRAARTGEKRDVARYIPKHVREAVIARDGARCQGCGATQELHLDHIVPHAHGGPSTIDNLRVVCASSNLRRGVGPPGDILLCAK